MPSWLSIVVKLNPLTYTIELVRTLIIGNSIPNIHLFIDISVLASFVITIILVAAYMFKREVSKAF